jgi:hypothetical protein
VRRKAAALQDIRQVVEDKLAQMVAQNPLRMDYSATVVFCSVRHEYRCCVGYFCGDPKPNPGAKMEIRVVASVWFSDIIVNSMRQRSWSGLYGSGTISFIIGLLTIH